MRKQVTLRNVADKAGVHVSTVSRVLREERGRIKPETADRVVAVAQELGFQRNRWAASLRSGKTGVLAVLVPRITDVVLATVFESIESKAAQVGYQAVVSSTWDDPTSRDHQIRRYLGERVDGLIIGDARIRDPALSQMTREGVPFLLVSRPSRGYPSVAGRDRYGGRLAANHLLDRGTRNLAVIAGPDYASTAVERAGGFVTAARLRGVEISRDAIVPSTFDVVGGRVAMQKILARSQPDGVFAVNDYAAIGAMGALREAGLVPGEDVAVVGYNDIDVSAQLSVPLTSVRTPLEQLGALAVEGMLELLSTGATRSVRLTPQLIPRQSTGA